MFELQKIAVDGHQLAALSFNRQLSGTPLIFIHGIASSVYFWSVGQTDLIQERFPWYSLSLPGHYPATFPPGFQRDQLTPELMVKLLVSAIQELVGDQQVIVMGHSTGGFAALNIAARAPQLVKGVASISGFAQGQWIGILGLMQRLARSGALGRQLFKTGFQMTMLTKAFYRYTLRNYAADAKALYAFPGLNHILDQIYPAARQVDLNALLHYFYRMPDIDTSDVLPCIQVPALVLAGDHDPIVPPAQARLIAEKVPGAKLVMLNGAGHLPMAERSAAYHEAITDWLTPLAD
ncbi:MAG TPA: alpha/beta hydrolase [Aggregatilineaceae bacterium]|nr:alpha/beta hydrolase [Aggregatilineaceae bacterium]